MSSSHDADDGWRVRKARQTATSLADAALKLFASQGYDETTVEEIADAAGVSRRTFFRYYSSKEELLFLQPETQRPLLFVSREAFGTALASILAEDDAHSDLGAVGAALIAMSSALETEKQRLALFTTALASSAALRGRSSDSIDLTAELIGDAVAKRRATSLESGRATGAVAMALYRRAVRNWIATSTKRKLSTFVVEEFARAEQMTTPRIGAVNGGRRKHND